MRFQIITNRDLATQIIPVLNSNGYKHVFNPYTGGDNDFLLIDPENQEYSWFEQGFKPYYSDIPYLECENITEIQEQRGEFNRVVKKANSVFNNENLSWEEKYYAIFEDDIYVKIYSLYPEFTWHDPDGSNEEDVTAFINGLNEFFKNSIIV